MLVFKGMRIFHEAELDERMRRRWSGKPHRTNPAGATLKGAVSGGIVGSPSALPASWSLINGWLVGPGAPLYRANLAGVDLSNAELTGTVWVEANLTIVDGSGAAPHNRVESHHPMYDCGSPAIRY